MNNQKINIIGGTGAVGNSLIDKLTQNNPNDTILSLVRNAQKINNPKVIQLKVDFDQLQNHSRFITGTTAISCIGTTLKQAKSKSNQKKVDVTYPLQFAKIAKENKIQTFVLVSSMMANSQSSNFYLQIKGELENEIKKLNFERLIIIRPSAIIRPNSKRIGGGR